MLSVERSACRHACPDSGRALSLGFDTRLDIAHQCRSDRRLVLDLERLREPRQHDIEACHQDQLDHDAIGDVRSERGKLLACRLALGDQLAREDQRRLLRGIEA